jgi:chitinase
MCEISIQVMMITVSPRHPQQQHSMKEYATWRFPKRQSHQVNDIQRVRVMDFVSDQLYNEGSSGA